MSRPSLEMLSARRIRQARGREAADLVVKNAEIFYLTTGEILRGDIAVCGDTIVGVGESYEGVREIDGSGCVAVPGFIDSHVHLESSLLTPYEYERLVLPRGVTSAICDPHELANVAGEAAIEYFSAAARGMLMHLEVRISSCVPATALETSGAELDAAQLALLAARHPGAGLGEMMNFPGVLSADREVLAKLAAFSGRCIDGHAPLVTGRDLNALLAAGIGSDHESVSCFEALEKLQRGMTILIREGSAGRNLDTLAPIIKRDNSPFLAFCTDDRSPEALLAEGGIDGMIRRAIELGAEPLAVYRAATVSAARAMGLAKRGLLAPGYRADVVILDHWRSCRAQLVISGGRVIDEAAFAARPAPPPVTEFRHSVKCRKLAEEDFRFRSEAVSLPVMTVEPGSLLTGREECRLRSDGNGRSADPGADVLKAAVIERHGRNGNIGLGFVRGFGLKRGAIASSVGHDSHNLCVVGVDDADMAAAANALIESQGGLVVVSDGRVVELLPLPVAGLMSEAPAGEVTAALRKLLAAAAALGCRLPEPFLQLSFLPLPVIPHLKLTDRGLVDVDSFRLLEF